MTSPQSQPPHQLLYRSAAGFASASATSNPGDVAQLSVPGECSAFKASRNGTLVAYLSNSRLCVIRLVDSVVVYEFVRQDLTALSVSSKGTYVYTWGHLYSETEPNMLVHHIPSKSVIASFFHRQQSTWLPQWSEDESMFAYLSAPDLISIYSTTVTEPGALLSCRKLKAEPGCKIDAFSVSPSVSPVFAVFSGEVRNSRPAVVRLFNSDNLRVAISTTSFHNAERVKFSWNPKGNCVLVICYNDVDKSGKSYYGDSSLHFVSTVAEFNCKVHLDKEGSVHDVCWSPNSREFAVVYGRMPAKAALFSMRAVLIYDFGSEPRNTLSFCPNGRFLMVAGFGNLPGYMDIWDMVDYKKLCSAMCPNTTYTEWSPDGKYLMTATQAPRLRVDNGWRIWHYQGSCIAEKDVPELYQVCWRPVVQTRNAAGLWARRKLSPPPKSVIETPPPSAGGGFYIPPGARAAALVAATSNSTAGDSSASAAGSGKPKPRVPAGAIFLTEDAGTKKAKAAAKRAVWRASEAQNGGKVPNEVPAEVDAAGPATEECSKRRARQLQKQLSQIQKIKALVEQGKVLDEDQLRKLASEPETAAEISRLAPANR